MAYVDTRKVLPLDEQFDGVLTAVAFAGGVVALPEVARYLGSEHAARALIDECTEQDLAYVWPTGEFEVRHHMKGHGLWAPAFQLRMQAIWRLAGDERGEQSHTPYTLLELQAMTSLFIYGMQTRRTATAPLRALGSPRFQPGSPTEHLLRRVVHTVMDACTVYLDADEEVDGLLSILPLTWAFGFAETWRALPDLAAILGEPLRWRWLVGSPFEAERAQALAAMFVAGPVGVQIEIVETHASRYFVRAVDRPRLGLPELVPPPRHPRWVVKPVIEPGSRAASPGAR